MNEQIRILLVDDEPLSRATLRAYAAADPELQIVGECRDGACAVTSIRNLDPDLVLLDIHMPVLDGFEVLAQLDLDVPPAVVFVTAYDEYAVQAFEVAAADFLLKPYDARRFRVALERAKDRVYRSRAAGDDPEPSTLAPLASAGAARDARYTDRLLVKEKGRIYLLPVRSIAWVESAGNYVRIHTRNRSHIVRMKVSDLETILDPSMFARVHRTKIVNLDRIQSLKPAVNGSYVITMKGGSEFQMSKLYARNVLGPMEGRVRAEL
jgi:two-component system, LytTR family, response regulator